MALGKANDDAARIDDSIEEGFGDVEAAGETTAAVAISGPPDTRPVGADTLVKVADTAGQAEGDKERGGKE